MADTGSNAFLKGLRDGIYDLTIDPPADPDEQAQYGEGYHKGTNARNDFLAENSPDLLEAYAKGVIDGWVRTDAQLARHEEQGPVSRIPKAH